MTIPVYAMRSKRFNAADDQNDEPRDSFSASYQSRRPWSKICWLYWWLMTGVLARDGDQKIIHGVISETFGKYVR